MNHNFSVSELETVCSVYVADYPLQIVFVHNIRDSGVGTRECQSTRLFAAKDLDIMPTNGGQYHPPP